MMSGYLNEYALAGILLLLSGLLSPALSQTIDCSAYDSAVVGGARGGSDYSPPIPDDMLTNDKIDLALPCLIRAIKNMRGEIKSADFGEPTRGKFNRATGAIHSMMVNNEKNAEASKRIITALRLNNSIDAVSVLTFGLRGSDYGSRLNALVILGNIIDNTTVCVPIDHLYDPVLDQDGDLPAKWRANLFGVVAVPAPWANKENYNAIARVRAFWAHKVEQSDKLKPLADVLANIEDRLNSRTNVNRTQSLQQAGLTSCLTYVPKWANASEWMKDLAP
jgi:hypothetical protein